jgi:hypothetical protein
MTCFFFWKRPFWGGVLAFVWEPLTLELGPCVISRKTVTLCHEDGIH